MVRIHTKPVVIYNLKYLKIWNNFKMCQSKTNVIINITVEILYLEAE